MINDWNGEMTFTGFETLPSYTATNGEITISGSVQSGEMKNSGESAWH